MPSGSDTAKALKEKGNACFKNGQRAEAAQYYYKAEKADPTDAVYPSNLSAALYELGDYAGCINAIQRSAQLESSSPALLAKLSTRLAKALSHGVISGQIASPVLQEKHSLINTLRLIGNDDAENKRVWKDWSLVEASTGDREVEGKEARSRLSRLPTSRKAVVPTLEYYSIGQDQVMSLMDDWGPEDPYPLPLNALPVERLSEISFLFGGIGDARHAFGTVIGTHRAWKTLNKSKRNKFKLHMTLLDIHPAALVRDLCIMMLIDALIEGKQDAVSQVEIKATIFYTYLGVVLPSYCHERLRAVMLDIKARLLTDTPQLRRLPAWIHVDSESIPALLVIIDKWVSARKSTQLTLMHHIVETAGSSMDILDNPAISPEYRERMKSNRDRQRQQISEYIDTLDDAQMRAMGLIQPGETLAQGRNLLNSRREAVIDVMLKAHLDGNVTAKMDSEQKWYETTKAFLPPSELWSRHPGFDKYLRMRGGAKLSAALKKKLQDHIEKDWYPNITLFDFGQPYERYPDLKLDAFQAPRSIEEFNDRFDISKTSTTTEPDAPAFSHTTDFFDAVIDALKAMSGHVTFEILRGELSQELSKMRFAGDTSRPAEFPRSYTRAWLSNVPDYTHGLMNTALYTLPNIQEGKIAAVASNCLLNSGIWSNDDEFCYTYTLLRPEDVPRYLGCRLDRKDGIWGLIVVGNNKLPRPASELASREELVSWLTRVFLYTIIPGTAGTGPFRARLPNNLVTFVNLLIHLHGVGFPAHWLAEFLQSILSDTLVTDIGPYTQKWPIPLSDMSRRVPRRKVRLDLWRAEFENILAVAHAGLPFSIPFPADFARSYADIGLYEAVVKPTDREMPGTIFNPLPAWDPVVCLLFYKQSVDPRALVSSLPAILDGKQQPRAGDAFVLTAQEGVDLPGGKVSWRMSRSRTAKMRAEQWRMIVYRTDAQAPATHPAPASTWKDMDGDLDILPVD
ncbi:hypothetical protein PLICRDRAFT_157310 [Plicaturopsis crispa FD-325 SS-3]|nr:hypothetical protein PLICRDRAFT_157310 [Plicaturopsis crispa FD-325 SS-3]